MALWLQDRYLQFGFSPKAAKLLIREQGLDSPEKLRVFADKNVDYICCHEGNRWQECQWNA